MDAGTYKYRTLENLRSIRLVVLGPSVTSDRPLECKIHHVSVDSPPPYGALSYEWKGESPQLPLACGDGSTILITPNCHAALRRLRHKRYPQALWVDAISINQDDIPERNSQVSMMFEIYKSSTYTYVWLGQGDLESDLALKLARRADFIYRHKYLKALLRMSKNGVGSWNMLGTGCTEEALASLVNRSYWTRMWTIQEFAASNPVIYCGDAKPVSGLAALIAIDEIHTAHNYAMPNIVFPIRTHLLLIMSGETGSSFSTHVRQLSRMSCKDERDKIFASIGLFRNVLGDIIVDYDRPVWDIYTDATALAIINENSLHILEYVARSGIETRFPSWVVDWSDKQTDRLNPRMSSKRSGPLFRFSSDNKTLYLTGKVVGMVSRDISSQFPIFNIRLDEIVFDGRQIDIPQRNSISLKILCNFYLNSTTPTYPDRRTYFQAIITFLDPDTNFDVITQGIVDMVCNEDNYISNLEIEYDASRFLDALNGIFLFTTSDGRFGISRTDGIQCGDKISLISGFNKPLIMREVEGGYHLIGPVIVDGLMDGEMWPDDETSLDEFAIL